MLRDEFELWLARDRRDVFVMPYRVIECDCSDLNCHGWRLVPWSVDKKPMARATLASVPRRRRELTYEPVEPIP